MDEAQLRPESSSPTARAVERVEERLRRAMDALITADVNAAVIGAKAVEAWVRCADEGAVRNTPNVDLMIHRSEAAPAEAALAGVGFGRRGDGVQPAVYSDGPAGPLRQAVRLWFADEPVTPGGEPLPSMPDTLPTLPYRRVSLPALVRMKLNAFRTIDRVHLQDLIGVGLIDASWLAKYPPVLAARLQHILDTPDG